jgi:hypothetical protein
LLHRFVSPFTILLGVTPRVERDHHATNVTSTSGTFTSEAGLDGQAAQRLPLAGPSDLPCFVNYYQNRLFKIVGASGITQKDPVDYLKARSQLLGPMRMETPVLYFYSARPEKVDVRVAFPKGFITEWFPQATINQTPVRKEVLEKSENTGATITWKNVEILPRDKAVSFPQGSSPSHYYAARATDANPVRVNGRTKILFIAVLAIPVPSM